MHLAYFASLFHATCTVVMRPALFPCDQGACRPTFSAPSPRLARCKAPLHAPSRSQNVIAARCQRRKEGKPVVHA